MKNWKEFWENFWVAYPEKAGDTQYFEQVGKTIHGVPISPQQYDSLIDDVEKMLALNEHDHVLDLCCGNGLITSEIAKKCSNVVGVDFSEVLIRRAKENKQSPNIEYLQMDARKIRNLSDEYQGYFTKVLWYEALAFFDKKDLREILDAIKTITTNDALILIGSVLDAERKWNFFNTLGRKFNYIVNIVLLGREVGLGKWWKRKEIEETCNQLGFKYEFHYQNKILHTAHYRIDIKLSRREAAMPVLLSLNQI